MSYGVTDDGFIAKTFSEIRDDIYDRIEEEFDDLNIDIDLGETSPIAQIADAFAVEVSKMWDTLENIYYCSYVETSSDAALDKTASITGTIREGASQSTGEVTFTSSETSPITITEGATLLTSDEELEFITTEDATTISGASYWYASGVAIESLEYGEHTNVSANTITEFLDPIVGISDVTNPEATTGGDDVETDENLRARSVLALDIEAKSTKVAIETALEALDDIDSVVITEDNANPGEFYVTIGSNTLVKTDPDDAELVEDTIDDVRAFGIVYDWDIASGIYINVECEVHLDDDYDTDWDTQVEESIEDYINDLKTGEDVIYNKIIDVVYNTDDWVYDITSLQIAKSGEALGTNNITISSVEKAHASGITITEYSA